MACGSACGRRAPRKWQCCWKMAGEGPPPPPPPLPGGGGGAACVGGGGGGGGGVGRGGGGSAAIIPMVGEAEGWFSVTTGEAGPGSRYRYRVDGTDYPDPASRHQPDGVHGASEVIDPGAYRWRDAKWQGRPWRELVIYE